MYAPEPFAERRLDVLHGAIRAIGFASLVSQGDGGLEASHIPTLLDASVGEFGLLEGHFARANPHWRSLQAGGEALALYTAANAYISPNWYPTKAETGKVVPTWNYLAVQVRGRVEVFDDAAALTDLVTRLTETHERGRPEPWAVSDAPADYVATMVRGIVGFRLTIGRIEGAWKMSQNRPVADQAGVRSGLAANGDARSAAVAAMMNALPPKET
jgi:transcriptional regulator